MFIFIISNYMKIGYSNFSSLIGKYLLCFALLIVVISISCKKEINPVNTQLTDNIDANNLKLWFDQNGTALKDQVNWLSTLKPNWKNITRVTNEIENIYEIELDNPERIFGSSSDVDIKSVKTFENRSLLKLIIIENKMNLKYTAAIIELIAFENNKVELKEIHYKSYKGFTGAVNFYELTGQFSNGWIYRDGKIIASTDNFQDLSKVSFTVSNRLAKGKIMLAAAEPVECGRISIPHWRQNCITIGSIQGWGYSGTAETTTCTWEIYHTIEIIYCPNLNDDGGDGGGGYTGGGSSNNSSSSTDPGCGKVKEQTSTAAYKEKANDLKGKTNLKKETGFEEKKDGSFTEANNSGDNSLSANPDANTKGFIHTHLNDYQKGDAKPDGSITMIYPIRMLSPGDVNTLMNIVNQNINNGDFSSYYVSMVSNYSHYMIKFSGTSTDVKTGFGGADWANKYRDFMADYVDLERGFLRFLKEKMGVNGVKLYEIKNNGDIKTIDLKLDGKSKDKKDC